jgi:hypothetical protein
MTANWRAFRRAELPLMAGCSRIVRTSGLDPKETIAIGSFRAIKSRTFPKTRLSATGMTQLPPDPFYR